MTISDLVNQIESNFKYIKFSIIKDDKVLFFRENGTPCAELKFFDSQVSFFEYDKKLTEPQRRSVTFCPKR
jgi:hypothetical protein